ncbi:MAG: T9SS type A sorting domain-containing protein [Hymenobacteraceae bacterium]|nr:T9SS type A sorting domain-containing protein [Hymenobacteraceae bacterium]
MNSFFTLPTSLRNARRIALPALVAGFSLTTLSAFAQPDLVVSVDGPVPGGSYHNVTVVSNVNATLNGQVNVTGTFTVQSNAEVAISDVDFVSGNNFVLENDGALRLETTLGIGGTISGPIRTVSKNLGTKGRFIFNNVTQAQLTGESFPNEVSELVINNASGFGVGLSRPLGVRERLYLRNGVLRTNGHKLTLISRTPDIAMVTAASCVVFQQNGSVDGIVTAQRFINPRFNDGVGYRHYSTSVSGLTAKVANFSTPPNFDAIVNPQYNDTPYARRFVLGVITPYPNTFFYDETQVGTGGPGSYDYVFNQGYQSPNSIQDPLVNTRGYTVRIPASSTVEFAGTLNNGDISTPILTRGPFGGSGWHLVGNPYASKIDWTLLNRVGVINSFYKNRSTGVTSGVYDSYVNGVGTGPSGNEFIAANQAVFTRVNGDPIANPSGVGQITFTNSARINEFRNDPTAPFFRTAQAAATFPLVRLALQNMDNSKEIESVVCFREGATTGFDSNFDAYFINGGYELGIYSQVGNDGMSINGLPALTSTTDYTVAMMANVWNAGTFKINATELANVPAGFEVLLQDALTGTTQNLVQNPVYTFTSTGRNANNSRFTIRFRAAGVTGISDAVSTQAFDVYPNPIKSSERLNILLPGIEQGKTVSAVLVNQVGQKVWSASFRSALGGVREEVKTDFARGVYTLQVTLPDGAKQSRRVIVK